MDQFHSLTISHNANSEPIAVDPAFWWARSIFFWASDSHKNNHSSHVFCRLPIKTRRPRRIHDWTKGPLFEKQAWQTTSKIISVLLNSQTSQCSWTLMNTHNNSHSVSRCMVARPGRNFKSQGPTWPASAFVVRLSRPPRSDVRAPWSSQRTMWRDVKGWGDLDRLRTR